MNQYLVGEPRELSWSITKDGVAYDLTNKSITLELITPNAQRIIVQIKGTVDNNVVFDLPEQVLFQAGTFGLRLWDSSTSPLTLISGIQQAFRLVTSPEEVSDEESIYSEVASRQIMFDEEPTAGSINAVTSRGIKAALDNKVDNATVGDLSLLQTAAKKDLVSAINEARVGSGAGGKTTFTMNGSILVISSVGGATYVEDGTLIIR